MQKLIADLDGKELANGKLALAMAETADGKDWKLVAHKEKRNERKLPFAKLVLDETSATQLADDLLAAFDGIPKAGPPKLGFMIFLCQRYPDSILRDALSRTKADYLGSVRKTVGAVFRYDLEQLVARRDDLVWYK